MYIHTTAARGGGGLVLLFLLCVPLVSFAQSSSSRYRNTEGRSEISGQEREAISAWRRQNSATQKKVDALDDDAVKSIPIPVLGITRNSITPDFGDPRDGGARSHEGQDILAPKDALVVSPTEAVVLRVGTGENSGKNVYTANPGGETFVYMHLNKFASGLSAGDELKKGELVGYVGNTGNASGGVTHLHFEIRKDGKATDPYPRLTGAFTQKELEEIADDLDIPIPGLAVKTSRTSGAAFVRDLQAGSTGEDVRALQQFLNTHGFVVASSGAGSVGNETTYFGAATRAALIAFQNKYAIVPAAGYFGSITRTLISAFNS